MKLDGKNYHFISIRLILLTVSWILMHKQPLIKNNESVLFTVLKIYPSTLQQILV